jgi:hypothetical protein
MGSTLSIKTKTHVFQPLRWLKILAFSLLALNGLLRIQQTVVYWRFILNNQIEPGPLYFTLSGAWMILAGLAAAFSLGRRLPAADWIATAAALLTLAWAWIDRAFVSRSPDAMTNAPFMAGFSLAAVIIVIWPLVHSRKKVIRER